MPLPLPDLDDRVFSDLVDEAQALIHRHAPGWTDYNLSDPGITLIDLLAWMTEADVFATDQIPSRHRDRFLALTGIGRRAVQPAQTPLAFTSTSRPLTLPAGVVFDATTDDQLPVGHQLADDVQVLGCALTAVQVWTGTDYVDRTHDWRHDNAFDVLGPDPSAGAAMLLGLDPAPVLNATDRMSMWLALDDSAGSPPDDESPAAHHSVTMVWEYHDGTDWVLFSNVVDETRSLTRSGRVVVPLGEMGASATVGAVTQPLRWLRVSLQYGRHDVAPRARGLLIDAAAVVQSTPSFAVWHYANPAYSPPSRFAVGRRVRFRVRTDAAGRVISFGDPSGPDDPQALVVAKSAGSITLTLATGGVADGAPLFEGSVTGCPFTGDQVEVWTANSTGNTRWAMVDSLLRSGPGDYHVEFDAATGTIRFGDGEHGRIPAAGSTVFVRTDQTQGVAGTPTPRTQWQFDTRNPLTACLTAPVTVGVRAAPSKPARAADDLLTAESLAAEAVWAHERLVELVPSGVDGTLDQVGGDAVLARPRPERAAVDLDFERLALDVPGTAVRRARAWAGIDPAQPYDSAPGTVTVVVVPGLPAQRPTPTFELLTRLREYLCPRRTLGTRLVVTGPHYVEVVVRATVQAMPHANVERVRADVESRLYRFLHPLTGGPTGQGWPFGRDVFRNEVLRQLDLVSGVDHVDELELVADGVTSGCGNLCVGSICLVVSGTHEVTVR